MTKKINLFEIGYGDEVNKKLRQSKSLCKETKKKIKIHMRYIYKVMLQIQTILQYFYKLLMLFQHFSSNYWEVKI